MGGSWDTLKWAKDTRVGNHADKLVLLVMADKANERFELYPSKKELAYDCEMSTRRIGDHQQSLADKGLITVVERLRANGAQARTTVVINHPSAPHMNGEPIVLDYQGYWNYPKYPELLRDAGIQWISGTELNAVRPGASANGAAAQGGVTGRPPRGETERHGRGDAATPLGDDGSSPQNQPTESPTTNQAPDAFGVGWLDAKKKIPNTAGAWYLRELTLPDGTKFAASAVRALYEHVDACLAAGWTEQGITDVITNAEGTKVRKWGGFARQKLVDLPLQPPSQPATTTPGQQAHDEVTRMASQRDGRGARRAANLLGISWQEPERGEMSAHEHLVHAVPAAAREFVERHREDLVATLTRSAAASRAA